MSDLENSIATIIEVFHKYSEKEGDKHKLKKSELRDLINNELSNFMGHIKDQATIDSLMESLDTDGDSECDFQEFMTFVTMVTICCHEFFEHREDELPCFTDKWRHHPNVCNALLWWRNDRNVSSMPVRIYCAYKIG